MLGGRVSRVLGRNVHVLDLAYEGKHSPPGELDRPSGLRRRNLCLVVARRWRIRAAPEFMARLGIPWIRSYLRAPDSMVLFMMEHSGDHKRDKVDGQCDGAYPGESYYELRGGTGVAVDKFGLRCAHVTRKEGGYKDDTD